MVANPFFHAFFVLAVSGESSGYSFSSFSAFPFGEEAGWCCLVVSSSLADAATISSS